MTDPIDIAELRRLIVGLDPLKSLADVIKADFTDPETGEVDHDFYGTDIWLVSRGYRTAQAHLDLRDAYIKAILDEVERLRGLLGDAADFVEQVVQENEANWGERLQHKQAPARECLEKIRKALECS